MRIIVPIAALFIVPIAALIGGLFVGLSWVILYDATTIEGSLGALGTMILLMALGIWIKITAKTGSSEEKKHG